MTGFVRFPGAKQLILATMCAMMLVTAGCSSGPRDQQLAMGYDEPNDPLESVNRAIFDFNMILDDALIRPVSELYRTLLPQEARDSIRNFLRNLSTPVVLANNLLQGDMEGAGNTVARFLVNTSIGVGGVLDLADDQGYPYRDEDFGQTMAVHGSGDGFYLVLPILGPSTARDAFGRVVDTFMDPLTYIANDTENDEWLMARSVVSGIDTRSRNIETIEELRRDSVDFYARVRSLYYQRRAKEISNGDGMDYMPAPGLDEPQEN